MMISVGRIINYMNHDEEEITKKEADQIEELEFYNNIEYPIVVENVTLKYGKRTVLSNLNFKVRAKARIGIYGASGSGKHSIMNLILGIFKHNEGKLTVFGKPIEKVSKKDVRELSFYVDQTPTLFAGTVRENIDPNYKYSNSDLIKVLAYLGFYDLIKINTASFKDMKEWELIQRDANCKMTLMVNLANFIQENEEKRHRGKMRRSPSRSMSIISHNNRSLMQKSVVSKNGPANRLNPEDKMFNKIYEGLVADMLLDSKFASKLMESNMSFNTFINENNQKRTLVF
jgi:ABC-type sugar transport system ATPase subunit